MVQRFTVSAHHKRLMNCFKAGLAISALWSPLVLMATPAYANASDVFRGGGGRGAASGRFRGGGVRDTRCLAGAADQTMTDSSLNAEDKVQEEQEIYALLPGIEQATSQSTPKFLLYVPFDRQGDPMELVFELAIQTANAQRNMIESIPLQLPNSPGVVEFQLPANLALESGNLYDWSFRLRCSTDAVDLSLNTPVVEETSSAGDTALEAGDLDISILAPAAQNDVPRSGKVLQEVFGTMRLIDPPEQLISAQTTPDVIDDYQAYVDHDMWIDLVPAVLDASSSDFELLLEQEFDLDIDAEQLTIEILEAS